MQWKMRRRKKNQKKNSGPLRVLGKGGGIQENGHRLRRVHSLPESGWWKRGEPREITPLVAFVWSASLAIRSRKWLKSGCFSSVLLLQLLLLLLWQLLLLLLLLLPLGAASEECKCRVAATKILKQRTSCLIKTEKILYRDRDR